MARTFEPVDRHDVDAHPLCRHGMAYGGTFMDDGDAVRLEVVDMLLGTMACRLDDRHAAVDDRPAIFGIGRRRDRRQDRQVHPERLVGHGPAAVDFTPQIVGRRLSERGQHSQPTRIGHRRSQLGADDGTPQVSVVGRQDRVHLRRVTLGPLVEPAMSSSRDCARAKP